LRFGVVEADGFDVTKMACGVLATLNNLRVAMFTPLSVACAESITAINNSNVELCSSSVVGLGIAAARRSKMASRFCAFIRDVMT
jgi:hypothetical protein